MENRRLTKSTQKTITQDPTEVEHYLKLQVQQFNEQKSRILDKINELHDMNEETFSLRQKLNKQSEQLFEVQSTVSNLQFALMQQQDQNLSLLKENDELRLRLVDYQKKVQILLSYANIPEDFPILSLVKGVKPEIVVEKKFPRKPRTLESHKTNEKNLDSTTECQCTIHKNIGISNQTICNACSKLTKKPDQTDSESDSEFFKENTRPYRNSKSIAICTKIHRHSNRSAKSSSSLSNLTTSNVIDDIDQANLVVQSLKAQIYEIKYNYDQHMDLVRQDMTLQQQEHKVHIENYVEDCEFYNTYVKNLHRVLYRYLYEDMCVQHMESSHLGDLYKYMVCVQKCKQILGDKFPQCVRTYLTNPQVEPAPSDQQFKLDQLTRQVNQLKEANTHLSLALSSMRVKQQENLIGMNERVELYQRKHNELLERKNKEGKLYRRQIDTLIAEINDIRGAR